MLDEINMINGKTVETVRFVRSITINPRLKSWANNNQLLIGNRFNGFINDYMIMVVEKGAEEVQKLGRIYNQIALYFVLPVIRLILLGKEKKD
jgi:hypothetical protein